MNPDIFADMPAAQLRAYIEFLLWHYRVMDSFWYIYIREQLGESGADSLNAKVWSRIASMGARDLMKRFQIHEPGLEGFVQALRYWPWCILVDYQIKKESDRVIVSVPACPTQEARIKRGLAEYHCREMHRGEFESFAGEIDARIQTECLFAPPDPRREGMICQWRFSLTGSVEKDV